MNFKPRSTSRNKKLMTSAKLNRKEKRKKARERMVLQRKLALDWCRKLRVHRTRPEVLMSIGLMETFFSTQEWTRVLTATLQGNVERARIQDLTISSRATGPMALKSLNDPTARKTSRSSVSLNGVASVSVTECNSSLTTIILCVMQKKVTSQSLQIGLQRIITILRHVASTVIKPDCPFTRTKGSPVCMPHASMSSTRRH